MAPACVASPGPSQHEETMVASKHVINANGFIESQCLVCVFWATVENMAFQHGGVNG